MQTGKQDVLNSNEHTNLKSVIIQLDNFNIFVKDSEKW